MYTCDDRCHDYGNGHICKHIHRVHSLQYHQQQDARDHSYEYQSASVYYPPNEEPTEDTTTSHGKHTTYNDIG